MKRTRTPSRLGPCGSWSIQSGSKFCSICGWTGGSHRFSSEAGYVIDLFDGRKRVSEKIEDDKTLRLEVRRMNKVKAAHQ